MKTIIVTCDRNPNYLKDTALYLRSQRIDFKVSHGSLTYNNLIEAEVKELCVLNDVFDEKFKKYSTRKKATLNYINALRLAKVYNEDVVILEDDVLVCNNFENNVQKLIKQINDKEYIVALYFPYKTNINELKPIPYKVENFYGLQGMFYTKGLIKKLELFLENKKGSAPHDFLLKDFCKENSINLYGTSLSLVQHMGKVSTGLGHHHTVKNFLNDFFK